MNQRDPFLKSVPEKVTFTETVQTELMIFFFNKTSGNLVTNISTNLSKCIYTLCPDV